MEKFFDFAFRPRFESTEVLYEKEGYFNYIPYEKINRYTNIKQIASDEKSVCVEPRYQEKGKLVFLTL